MTKTPRQEAQWMAREHRAWCFLTGCLRLLGRMPSVLPASPEDSNDKSSSALVRAPIAHRPRVGRDSDTLQSIFPTLHFSQSSWNSFSRYHLLLGEETLLGIFKGLIVTLSVIELENPRERLDGDLNPQPTCLIIIYLFIFL